MQDTGSSYPLGSDFGIRISNFEFSANPSTHRKNSALIGRAILDDFGSQRNYVAFASGP